MTEKREYASGGKLHYERVPIHGTKLSKSAVKYVDDHGASSERCAKCVHYLGRAACQIVAGRIDPEGWCNRFNGYAAGGGVEYQRPGYGGSLKGAYRIPHTALKAMGNGDLEAGRAVAGQMFGLHSALGSDTVHPEVVRELGGGSLAAGRRVLEKFVTTLRHRGEP
jgi:hypothetical protein